MAFGFVVNFVGKLTFPPLIGCRYLPILTLDPGVNTLDNFINFGVFFVALNNDHDFISSCSHNELYLLWTRVRGPQWYLGAG